jgi:hypothetical protein
MRAFRGYGRLALGILASLLLATCATLTTMKLATRDRGIEFPHPRHAEEEIACTDCHAIDGADAAMPDHEICGVCHDIDVDKADAKTCGQCHTRPDWTVTPRAKRLGGDVIFAHAAHIEKEIDCAVCHANPDKQALPKGPVKPFCMDCHGKIDPALNACSVCHKEVRRDKVPTHRYGARIAHDAPVIWEQTHGHEFRYDETYCGLCHDNQAFCQDCHQKTPPRDHTIAWRRKPHGLRATWDRDRCAACHEEDSCWKCHQETEPDSHRSGWAFPLNRHCANCHFPPRDAGCTTCHQRIEHGMAKPSPHKFAAYPTPCGACHPGGNPFRAPHPMNSTAECAICH